MINRAFSPSKIRVGVLRGGPSHEYDVSLQSGSAVLNSLPEKYIGRDIFIDRDGLWHMDGRVRTPDKILAHLDVVFNALHGQYGEDGQVQRILDSHNIPYTGSGTFASAFAMNKMFTKTHALKEKIKTPLHAIVRAGENIVERATYLFRSFPHPVIVKPVGAGSSVGVSIATTHASLLSAIEKALKIGEAVIVEEYISGKEATCGVVNDFRGHQFYTLPPVEIVPPKKNDFFDYDAKYGGESHKVCPGNFSEEEKKEIQRVSALIHQSLDLRHYSRSDFIVNPRRGIYFLEVNTLPGLTKESLLPKSLEAVGTHMPDFLDHVLSLALEGK